MSLCSWNASNGTTCKFPAPFSAGCHGDGRWYCVWHWRIREEDKITRHHEGDDIVKRSYEWDGETQSYLFLRGEAVKKPVGKSRGEGEEEQEGAGVSSHVRTDAKRETAVPIAQAAMEGLGGRVQPEYEAEW